MPEPDIHPQASAVPKAPSQLALHEKWSYDAEMTKFARELLHTPWQEDEHGFLLLPLSYSFDRWYDGYDKFPILLRPEVRQLWDDVLASLRQASPLAKLVKVRGNSGVGKSYTMTYLLKRLLEAQEPLVLYDHRKSFRLLAFVWHADQQEYHVYNILSKYFNPLCIGSEDFIWQERWSVSKWPPFVLPYLWDPSEEVQHNFLVSFLHRVHTVVPIPVDQQLVRNAYKMYDTANYYMSTNPLDFMLRLRALRYDDDDDDLLLDDNTVRRRFFRYGGLIRTVFREESVRVRRNREMDIYVSRLSEDKLPRLLEGSLEAHHAYLDAGLVRMVPSPQRVGDGRCSYDFASVYAYLLVAMNYWDSIMALTRTHKTYASWFEVLCLWKLAAGGDFRARSLDQKDLLLRDVYRNIHLAGAELRKVDSCSDPMEIYREWIPWPTGGSEGQERKLVGEMVPTMMECAHLPYCGFQVATTLGNHGLHYEQCKSILERHDKIYGLHQDLHLFFLVPEDLFKSFEKQRFLGSSSKDRSGRCMVGRIRQYVIGINRDHVNELIKMFQEENGDELGRLLSSVAVEQSMAARKRAQ